MNLNILLKMDLYYLTITNIFFSVQDMGASEAPEPFNYMSMVIYIVLGISVLLNILLLLFIKKNNRRNSKSSSGTMKGDKEWYETLEKANIKLKNDNKNLKDKLNSLKNTRISSNEEKENIPVESKPQSTTSNPIIEQEDEISDAIELKISKPNNIYLPSPFEDNRFSIEDVSNERTHSSLYQITLDDSNATGKLLILENADFTRALNSPDLYLEKACVYENAFNATARGISVVEPGKVKLDKDDWIITEKIKIKFI